MVTAKEVEEARFGLAQNGRIGYEETAVDDFLDRVTETLTELEATGRTPNGGVTSSEVVETTFRECPADQAAGYDPDEVDDLLDRITQRLFDHEQQAGTATERIGDDRPAADERAEYADAPAPELVDAPAVTGDRADDAAGDARGRDLDGTDRESVADEPDAAGRSEQDQATESDGRRDGFRDSRTIDLPSGAATTTALPTQGQAAVGDRGSSAGGGATAVGAAAASASRDGGAQHDETRGDERGLDNREALSPVDGGEARSAMSAHAVGDGATDGGAGNRETDAGRTPTAPDEAVGLVGGQPIDEAEQAHDHGDHHRAVQQPHGAVHRVGEQPRAFDDAPDSDQPDSDQRDESQARVGADESADDAASTDVVNQASSDLAGRSDATTDAGGLSAASQAAGPVADQPDTIETVEPVDAPSASAFAEPGVRAGEVGWRGGDTQQAGEPGGDIVGVASPNGYPTGRPEGVSSADVATGDAPRGASPQSSDRNDIAAVATNAPSETPRTATGSAETHEPVQGAATPVFDATDDQGAGFGEPGTVLRSQPGGAASEAAGSHGTSGGDDEWVDSRSLTTSAAPAASEDRTAAAPGSDATTATLGDRTMGDQWNQVTPDASHAPSKVDEDRPGDELAPADGVVKGSQSPAAPSTTDEVISYPATEHRVPLPRADASRQLTDEDIEAQSNYHPEYSEYATRDGYETAPPSESDAVTNESAPKESARPAADGRDARVGELPLRPTSGTRTDADGRPSESTSGEVSNVQHLQGQEQVGQEGQAGHGDAFEQAQRTGEAAPEPLTDDAQPWATHEAPEDPRPVGRPEPIDAPEPIDTPREVPTREEGEKPKGFLRRLFKG